MLGHVLAQGHVKQGASAEILTHSSVAFYVLSSPRL
jgi:hypothetical protein